MCKRTALLIVVVFFSSAILLWSVLPVGAFASSISDTADKTNTTYPAWYSYALTSSGWINTACVAVITFLADRKNKLVRGLPQSLLSHEFPPFQSFIDKFKKKSSFWSRLLKSLNSSLSNNDFLRICSFSLGLLTAFFAALNIGIFVILTWSLSTLFSICILIVQYFNNQVFNDKKVIEYLQKCLRKDIMELGTVSGVAAQHWQSTLICMCNNSAKENKKMEPNSYSNYHFILECLYTGLKQVLKNNISFPLQSEYTDSKSKEYPRFEFVCKALNKVLTYMLLINLNDNSKNLYSILDDIFECLDTKYKNNLDESAVFFLYAVEFFILHFLLEQQMNAHALFALNRFTPPAYSIVVVEDSNKCQEQYSFFVWLAAYGYWKAGDDPHARCVANCYSVEKMHEAMPITHKSNEISEAFLESVRVANTQIRNPSGLNPNIRSAYEQIVKLKGYLDTLIMLNNIANT